MAKKDIHVQVINPVAGTGPAIGFVGGAALPTDTVQLQSKIIGQTMVPTTAQNINDVDITTSYTGVISYTLNNNPATLTFIPIPITPQVIKALNQTECPGNTATITNYGVTFSIVGGFVQANVTQSYYMTKCMTFQDIKVETY